MKPFNLTLRNRGDAEWVEQRGANDEVVHVLVIRGKYLARVIPDRGRWRVEMRRADSEGDQTSVRFWRTLYKTGPASGPASVPRGAWESPNAAMVAAERELLASKLYG